MNINQLINSKALYKSYNPSRPAYNVLSPSYNFGEKIISIDWNWTIPCLNGRFKFYNSNFFNKYLRS